MNEAVAAFLGAVIGSGLLLFRDWIASAFNTRRRAKYLAIRVVTILDRFVDQCADVSQDNGYLGNNRGDPVATTDDPSAIIFPDDLDWRSIDHKMAYNLLALDNKIYDANQVISAAGDFASAPDYEEYYDARRLQYSLLGLEAASLARQLRDTHDLPRRTFDKWNPETLLEEARSKILASQEREKIRFPIFP